MLSVKSGRGCGLFTLCLLYTSKAFCPARLGELIRNPVYVKADGKVYQFFRDRGVRLLDPPGWYTGERGCYLYQEEKGSKAALTGCLAVLAPHRGIIDSDTWLACRRKCLEHRRAGPKGTEKSSWLVGKAVSYTHLKTVSVK